MITVYRKTKQNARKGSDKLSKLYTCKEIAERYGVEVITVWDWIRKKKLPALKLGKEYRVRDEDIKVFEESRLTTRSVV